MRGDLSTFSGVQIVVALLLCDGEASAFLSHRTRYSSDEAGDPTSGFLVPPDRRRRSTKREICSFSLVQHLSRPPSIDGPLGRVTPLDPAVPYRQIPMHTISRKHVRNSESERVSRKKAQVPREE